MKAKLRKLPTHDEIDNFDITGTVCSMHTVPKYPEQYAGVEQWPMYSFDRPSYMLWNAVGKELFRNGWSMEEIQTLLQSKHPRWALDGPLGDKMVEIGTQYATLMLAEHEQIKQWAKQK